MFDTKTNLLACVDAKSWSFKNWRYAQSAKIWNAHYNPPGVREQRNFGFPSFSLGGTSTPKNDQNRWVGGVKLLRSALEWAHSPSFLLSLPQKRQSRTSWIAISRKFARTQEKSRSQQEVLASLARSQDVAHPSMLQSVSTFQNWITLVIFLRLGWNLLCQSDSRPSI